MNEPSRAHFLVGIDLGTTHTVVAFRPLGPRSGAARPAKPIALAAQPVAPPTIPAAPPTGLVAQAAASRVAPGFGEPSRREGEASGPSDETAAVAIFPIRQRVTANEIAARPMLPSALYAALPDETPDRPGDAWITGEYARKRGAEVPGRLVASAKSWLCHPSVDRTAPILPWGVDTTDDDPTPVSHLSPVEASTRFLEVIRASWDAEHPAEPLEDQDVVLTVPASFDAAARELTVEATRRAGLEVRLLEEPQAAFYDWMHATGDAGLDVLLAGRDHATVLVVDVGGGTTDFSIMRVDASREITRVAVGDHLLLGGDNMDLALALRLEPALVEPHQRRLDAMRFGQLVVQCRHAKERLLGDAPPDELGVTLLGGGSRLIGGARHTELRREVVEQLVIEGFFPLVPSDATPDRGRAGLVSLGLPYARDSAISRHLAAFLARSGAGWPDAVLLNGGVFRATALVRRVVELVTRWSGAPVRTLEGADPDLAVARGAVTYAAALRGVGRRIGGGAAHTFYVGLTDARGERRAMCVIPRGGAVGHVFTAPRPLSLLVGQNARFELFSRADATPDRPGDLVDLNDEHFVALPPVATRLGTTSREISEVMVAIEGEISEVGTLDLACRELDATGAPTTTRHRLAFQLRGGVASSDAPPRSIAPSSLPPPSMPPPSRTLPGGRRIDDALALLTRVFGKAREPATEREVKDVVRDLEKSLGDRTSWTVEITRALFDAIAPHARNRRRSPEHERQFWSLAGYCLRPGYGYPGDEDRIALLSPLAAEGITHVRETRAWQQQFIGWRRVAGGLDEATQIVLRDMADPFLSTTVAGKKRPKIAPPAESFDELLSMASSLERVPAPRRAALGSWIVERAWTRRDPRLWDALGRVGARVPSRASVHYVVGARTAEEWVDDLLREKRWDDLASVPLCASRLARYTGDRARDVSERARREVVRRLRALPSSSVKEAWIHGIEEIVTTEEASASEFLGESLPVGLRLIV